MIIPGPTNSEMFDKAHTQEEKDFLISQISFGRIGTYEDIGNAVLYLSIPTSSWIAGKSIFANCGFI